MDEQTGAGARPPSPSPRARLIYACTAFLALGVLVAGVLALSGGSEGAGAAEAPGECLERWNSDRSARSFGRHNALAHGYSHAQVLTLTSDGSAPISAGDPDASCAVIFASTSLDPERVVAGQIYLQARWQPLNGLLDVERLAALQSEAVAAANTALTQTGELEPL